MPQRPWSIEINQFEGYIPNFWDDEYPIIGNKGQASAMTNINLLNPNVLTQGPGLVNLTNNSVVTTMIKGILRRYVEGLSAVAAVGGNKVYKLTTGEVTSDGNFPHTIDKAAVTSEDGEDVLYYQGAILYSYNHSGAAGDVGRWTGAASFDDDYMSTVPTGATTLQGDVPHPMWLGGDDVAYIGNGHYVATLNTTTFTDQALDLPVGEVVVAGGYTSNRNYIATNNQNVSVSAQAESSIYIWDGVSRSWEFQIRVYGKIGAIWIKNGVVYVFYQDISSTGGFKLGFISNNGVKDICNFTGSLPLYYQVTEIKNHIMWASSGQVWAYGAATNLLPTRLFQNCDGGYATLGGISNVFGVLYIASTDAVNFRLAQPSGYDVNAAWKTISFDVANGREKSVMSKISIFTEPISSGGQLDVTLKANYGAISKALTSVNGQLLTRHVILRDEFEVENFRLDFDWSAGSTTNPVKIRKIIIDGYYNLNQ